MNAKARNLHAAHVLIVDDDVLVAHHIAMMVSDAGAVVVGPAHTLSDGIELASKHRMDAAVVDFMLGKETSEELMSLLASRGIPLVLYSSHFEQSGDDNRQGRCIRLPKPASRERLLAEIERLLSY
jgi:two-component SAPR family response regulator